MRFGAYGHLHDKLEFIENRFSYASYFVFLVLEFLPVLIEKGFSPFYFGYFLNFYFLIFYIKIVFALVFSFQTNLISSNSELVCESCGYFDLTCFT